ncbi:hypothetical protein [Hymenobacter terrenus]|uniref:hypothetical protein n=1 Tax=Hymenobacter terrenus TaxID=1629124 RepID=UPI0006199098|nr:hypothetical protein [Hymenobacter terrenus]
MTAKKSGASPDKRRKYDEAFKTEAMRLASESRSTKAAARQLPTSAPSCFTAGSKPSSWLKWAVKKWRATRKCARYAPV